MIRGLKIDDSVKQVKETRCVRLGSNEGVRLVNADRSVALSGTEVTRLTTCSGASDDTTNIYLRQGPNNCDDPRGWT
jgi:hypothetical protein